MSNRNRRGWSLGRLPSSRLAYASGRGFYRHPLALETLELRTLLSVTSITDENVLFETDGQNLWSSGGEWSAREDFSWSLLDVDLGPLNLGGFHRTKLPWWLGGGTYSTGLQASFSAGLDLGLSGYYDVTAGNVSVDYQADLAVNAKNLDGTEISSLSYGDHFVVGAEQSADPEGIAMATEFAKAEAAISLDYDMYADASLVGKVANATLINTGFHVKEKGSQELLKAVVDPGQGEIGLWMLEKQVVGSSLPFHWEDPEVQGFKVDVYAPTLNTGVPDDAYEDSAWNGSQIVNSHLPVDRSQGQTRIDFVKVALDLDALLLYAATFAATEGAKPIGGGLSWSFGSSVAGVDLTLLDATLEAYLGIAQTMTFDPMMKVDLNFEDASGQPRPVSVETTPGSGVFETVTTKRIDVGQDIEIIHPGGDLNIDTDYVLDGTFSNNTAIFLSPAFKLTVMELGISSWIWNWHDSLYDNTFALSDPLRIATLFDKSFPLLGFSEIDGGDLELPVALPTTFEVSAGVSRPSIAEGEELVITGTVLDPDGTTGGSDTYTLDINWQDGNTQTVTLDSNTTASVPGVTFDPVTHVFSATHQYADEIGAQSISITAMGKPGQTDDATLSVEVTNVAPTIRLDPLFIDPSGAATVTGSYTDSGVEDSHTMTVAWGDSTSTEFNVGAIGTLNVGQTFTSGSHLLTVTSIDTSVGQVEFSLAGHNYAESTISGVLMMAVLDEDGGTGSDQANVPWGLSLAVVSYTEEIFEGDIAQVEFEFKDVFPTATSSQQYKLVVDWDDDNDPTESTFYVDVDSAGILFQEGWVYPSATDDAALYVTGVKRGVSPSGFDFEPTFRVERRYADDGSLTGNGTPPDPNDVVVNVMERDGPQGGIVIRPITVQNVAPTLALDPPENIGDNDVARLSGTIGDVGRLDAFELHVSWGDGSTYDNDDDSATPADAFEVFAMAPSSTGSQTFDVYHVYANVLVDASYSVEATVYDDHNPSDAVTVVFDKPAGDFDTLVVDTTHDESDGNFAAGDLSLREAIELANSNPGRETIVFAAALSGRTLSLDGSLGQLEIASDLDLLGQDITLDAGGNSRVLFVDVAASDALINGLTITGGSAAGGGILNQGQLSLVDVTISGNTTTGSESGGGILNEGKLWLVNSTISDNESASDGGGIDNSGELSAENSTVSGNWAATSGGGILNSGTLFVVNSTIATNTADGNQDDVGAGGGIFTEDGNSTTLHNTIVAGNIRGTAAIADDLSDVGFSGTPVQADSSYNVIGDAATGGGLSHDENGNQVGIDPLLDPAGLQDHGGPTPTIALLPGSPAIDAGDNSAAADLTSDQRGMPFVRDYGDGAGSAVDVGAYEVQSLMVDTLEDENDEDFAKGHLSLREAIELANAIPGAATIVFAGDLAGSTIHLTWGELPITDDLTIIGLGADQLAISGYGESPIFRVDDAGPTNISVVIQGLSLEDGYNPDSPDGGGIYSSENLAVESCTLANNSSDFGGGIRNDGTLTVVASTFADNSAGTSGGAIFNTGALTVTNSTFSGNSAYSGGGISSVDSGTLTVTNSTLANNVASDAGGGIANSGGMLTITNSLVGRNTAPTGPDVHNAGTIASAQYNLIEDGTGSGIVHGMNGNQVGIDPRLDPAGLQDRGGPTRTIALLSGSPAIDAGDNSAAAGLMSDQRDVPFVRDYGDGADNVVDVGAYEVQALMVDTLEDQTDDDLSAGHFSLREAIELANVIPGADSIVLAADLAGGTITLTGGELPITDHLTITGPGAGQLTISGNRASRMFIVDNVAPTTITVVIRGLSLEDGQRLTYPYGGAIYNRESLTVESCTFANNSSGYGGAIRNDGTATVNNSTLVDNSAGTVGGALFNVGTLTVTNSTLANNSAHSGGGISNSDFATLNVTNSTFANNSANYAGGAIGDPGGALTVTNSTLGNNSAGSYGGGIYHRRGIESGALTITNSLLGGNTARVGPDLSSAGSIASARSNVIEDGTDSGIVHGEDGNQVGVDPRLDPAGLQDHGGLTQTIALLPDSPAIDAGDDAAAAELMTDQRGVPFERMSGPAVDVGAYEVQPLALLVDTSEDESDGDFSVGDVSLREAIELANANPGAETIVFAPVLSGSAITLNSGELLITDDLTIAGLGADQLTISANHASRIFTVDDAKPTNITAVIRGLSLVDGSRSTSPYGGAILNRESLTVENCKLTEHSSDYGGAIRNDGTLTVIHSTLVDNSAGTVGGAVFNTGTLTVIHSTLADNSAHSGGGIFNNDFGTLTVTNSTLANNVANYLGGAIGNMGGTLTVTNSTLANNTAGNYGGGIEHSMGIEPGMLTITSSLVAGNTAPVGPDLRNVGTIASAQYNVIQDGAGSGIVHGVDGNQVGVDPRLDPAGLQDHGGPTKTIALLPGSPAINACDDAAAELTTDQRSVPFERIYGPAADVGAYEAQTLSFVVDTSADESNGDFSASDLALREAIALANANPGADSIHFSSDLAGSTITLTSGELTITDDLTIIGLGADQLTVSGNQATRVFRVDNGSSAMITVEIVGLSVQDGHSDDGGAILNREQLTVTESTIVDNLADYGGGIANFGAMTVNLSTLANNSAGRFGGGINNYGTLTITDSTVGGNTAPVGPDIYLSFVGDANRDGRFDSSDLVTVFVAGQYEDSIEDNSTWVEGDWNGDGEFDSSDLVMAFQSGMYEVEPALNAREFAAAVDWLFAQDERATRSRACVA